MKLGSKSRYAVMAMADLALVSGAQKKPISLSYLAKRQQLPLAYLEQLFNRMKRAGLVQSTRGAMGGYVLSGEASQVPLMDIIQSVDTPLQFTKCTKQEGKGCGPLGAKCMTHDVWAQLDCLIGNFLKTKTLFDIIENMNSEKSSDGIGHSFLDLLMIEGQTGLLEKDFQ